MIPFNERHLQVTIRDWAIHYHRGRPHSALGPGLPEPMSDQVPSNEHRHSLPIGYQVVKRSVLGGLHHEYGLKTEAAFFCGPQLSGQFIFQRASTLFDEFFDRTATDPMMARGR